MSLLIIFSQITDIGTVIVHFLLEITHKIIKLMTYFFRLGTIGPAYKPANLYSLKIMRCRSVYFLAY